MKKLYDTRFAISWTKMIASEMRSLQLKFDKGKKKSGRLGRKIKGKLYLLGLENECGVSI